MIRIFLADDHAIFRDGMARILKAAGMDIAGEASDVASTLAGVAAAKPDVLLLDVAMPGGGGREVLLKLREQLPEVKVVVLSTYAEDAYAAWLMKTGAKAYLTKGRSAAELVSAIRSVAEGGTYVTDEIAKRLERDTPATGEPPHTRLSPREHEVFRLLLLGKTPSEVGYELELSPSTVSTLIARIRAELGVDSVPALLVYASKHGIL